MKKIGKWLCAGLLALRILPAAAGEGMWLPSLIASRMEDLRANGFQLTADDIYSVNQASLKDAVVLFGGFCTGAIVSDAGLLLTNHHCGYGAVQSHSTIDHDYLTDGFWARTRDEELPNEGLWVRILVRMEEVTERIAAGETAEAIVAEAEAEGPSLKASVEQMYYGNQQFLFLYRQYDDVRLVGAPPSSIGKFGGDTDNWIWPRHTGDFSLFRIYAGPDNEPAPYSPRNRPYRPRRHFTVSTRGVDEGDFTLIYGFPGSTQQYVLSDAVSYTEQADRMKIDLRTQRLEVITAAQEADPAVRIQYAAKRANIANAWKKWQGELLGLERLGTAAQKRASEARFAEWAADKPRYASLLDSMRAAYRVAPAYFQAELIRESLKAIELPARVRSRSADPLRQQAETAAFFKDYDEGIDRAIAVRMIDAYLHYAPAGDETRRKLLAAIAPCGGTEGYVARMFDKTRYVRPEGFSEPEGQAAEPDPVDAFNELIAGALAHEQAYNCRNLSELPGIARWYGPYMEALMAFEPGRPFYPDANLTLRVAYGPVGGYAYADGVWHTCRTTLDGIIAKDNPEIYDYDIPQRLRDLHAARDYGRWGCPVEGQVTVPVCFLASNHTTGGNSGSPVVNGRGELVGLNFDRTWRSTMSDLAFDPAICRNIAVDIRYVLFVIDKVGDAGMLVDEMTLTD